MALSDDDARTRQTEEAALLDREEHGRRTFWQSVCRERPPIQETDFSDAASWGPLELRSAMERDLEFDFRRRMKHYAWKVMQSQPALRTLPLEQFIRYVKKAESVLIREERRASAASGRAMWTAMGLLLYDETRGKQLIKRFGERCAQVEPDSTRSGAKASMYAWAKHGLVVVLANLNLIASNLRLELDR
jgi:hypothetical protein